MKAFAIGFVAGLVLGLLYAPDPTVKYEATHSDGAWHLSRA